MVDLHLSHLQHCLLQSLWEVFENLESPAHESLTWREGRQKVIGRQGLLGRQQQVHKAVPGSRHPGARVQGWRTRQDAEVPAGLRVFRAWAWIDSGSPATVRKDRAKNAIDPKNSRQCARMKSLNIRVPQCPLLHMPH